MTGVGKWGSGVVAILVAAGIGLAFANLFSDERVPGYRDLLVFVLPFKLFLADSLREGHLPLWNPYIYMGTPFLASLQSGVLYPPSLLLLAPFPLGFNLFLLAHFAIGFWGFWALLRDRGLSSAAAAIGAFTFVLGGYLVSMVNLTNNLQAGVWSPWVFLFWRRLRQDGRARSFALLVAALCLELLGGAPEVLILTVAVLAAWTVYDQWPRVSAIARSALRLAVALVFVLGITAFQIVPTVEYIGQSDRSQALSYDEVTTWSLQPVSFLQLLFPHSTSLDTVPGVNRSALGFERMRPWIDSIYLGLVPLALLVAGLVAGSERGFWGATALTAVVLALGRHGPLLPLFYDWLPGLIGKFRYPEKFFFLVHFAASLLVAEGFEAIVRRDFRAGRAAAAAAATFAGIAAMLVVMRWRAPSLYLHLVAVLTATNADFSSFVPLAFSLYLKAQRAMLLFGCFLAVMLFRRMAIVSTTTASLLIAAMVVVDLASIQYDLNSSISWAAVKSGRPFFDLDPVRDGHARLFLYQTISDPLPGNEPEPIHGLEHWSTLRGRSLDFEDFARKIWRISLLDVPMMQRVETLSGADGISRDSDNVMRNALAIVPREKAVKLLRIFGVARLMGQVELESADLEVVDPRQTYPYFAYRMKDPVPAAYLASRLIASTTSVDAFNHMISSDFRPGIDATVDEVPREWSEDSAEAPGTLSIAVWSAEHVALDVVATRPALLVLNGSFFPGWRATIDGKPVRILRTNALVRGVVVSPGSHRVEFSYRPESLRIGVLLSVATLVGAFGWAWLRGRRPPRRGSQMASGGARAEVGLGGS